MFIVNNIIIKAMSMNGSFIYPTLIAVAHAWFPFSEQALLKEVNLPLRSDDCHFFCLKASNS